MPDNIPSKSEIFSAVQAQAESLDDLSKRFRTVELSNEKQQDRNQTVTIAVLIAFIAIVVAVAIQVIISNRSDENFISNLLDQVHQTNTDNLDLKGQLKLLEQDNLALHKQIDSIRTLNPYLK